MILFFLIRTPYRVITRTSSFEVLSVLLWFVLFGC